EAVAAGGALGALRAALGAVARAGAAGAGGALQRVPALVPGEDVGVAAPEHIGLNGLLDRARDLVLGGPDVAQVDLRASLVAAERLGQEVDVHRAGKRVGDAQRRRGEVVHLHIGVDPALEVAVA